MAVRVLVLVAAFAVLYGCGQPSSPVEKQERQGGVEQARPEPSPKPTTALSASAGAQGNASASAVPSSEEQAERAEARCRVMTYVSEENMSQQESTALRERVANRMIRMLKEMQEDTTLTVIHANSMALDDLGVPRYPECKKEGE